MKQDIEMTTPVEKRFWSRVDTSGPCWIWTGLKTDRGYGQIWINGKMIRVHRWIYEQVCGPIEPGMVIDHLCRIRPCVRPSHLEATTPRQNVLRGVSSAAERAKQTHCKNGHEFTPENTYYRNEAQTQRGCRACIKLATVRKAERKLQRVTG